jgi:hypothetical protein
MSSKTYREANKDKIKAQKKAYYEANKEKVKAKSREYYEANKDRQKEQRNTWRKSNQDKMNEYNRAYRYRNRAQPHRGKIKQYGLTLERYNTLVSQTGDNCPICGVQFDWVNRHKANRPCIDHCHKTGEVRGIICGKCNAAIGMFSDSVETLGKAIQWLQSPKTTG